MELSLVVPIKLRAIRNGEGDDDDYSNVSSVSRGLAPVDVVDVYDDDDSNLACLNVERTCVENNRLRPWGW